MKKLTYTLAIAATFIMAVLLASCQLHPSSPEVEAAQAKVDSAKQDLRAAQQTATADEWEAFKAQAEAKIRINELSIADLKDRMSMSEKKDDVLYMEKINKLEKQNEALKARIRNHDSFENTKANWENFKKEFNHDMDELGKALKDLTVDNKK